jgi:predicted DNA-binding protein with PD1-like motif
VDGAKEEKTSANRTLIFALPPREEFPGGLRKIMTNRGIREGEIRFALGTLESANVLGLRGIEGIRPREGLEMISAQGRLVSRDRLCKIDAHLVERSGACHSVRIQDGVVKDLVEGVLRIGC